MNDLVYLLQNRQLSADTLYAHVVELFDCEKIDVTRLYSELSRISAVTTFANAHDPGITSAFTERTFELLAQYRSTREPSFSLASLLECEFDHAEIQSPGFLSTIAVSSNGHRRGHTDNAIVSDLDSNSECSDIAYNANNTNLVDTKDVGDSESAASHVILSTKRDCTDLRRVEQMANAPESGIVQSLSIDHSVFDPENPDKYSDDCKDRSRNSNQAKATKSITDTNRDDSTFDDSDTCIPTTDNSLDKRDISTESAIRINSYYQLYHKKPNDPYRPDDYYSTLNLRSGSSNEHGTSSVYDIAEHIT